MPSPHKPKSIALPNQSYISSWLWLTRRSDCRLCCLADKLTLLSCSESVFIATAASIDKLLTIATEVIPHWYIGPTNSRLLWKRTSFRLWLNNTFKI